MINYNNSCIYKLHCNDQSIKEIYIGSTSNFRNRRYYHKYCYLKKDTKVYKFIRENGGWDNWTMTLIKECNFETKKQLLNEEKNTIKKETNPLLNMVKKPIRTKEELKEWKKQHNIKNKEKYLAFNRTKKECDICHELKGRGNFAKHRRLCELKNNSLTD